MPLHDLALGAPGPADADPALVMADGTWSRGELRAEVDRWAAVARGLVPRGGRIAFLADNRPEVVALLLGVPAAGRLLVPLNTRLTPDEVAAQLTQVGAAALVATADELARVARALVDVPTLATTVDLDAAPDPIRLAAAGVDARPTDPEQAVDGEAVVSDTDPAWIIFTSGTTGRAKGVVLTAAGLAAGVATSRAARPLAEDELYLYPFPLYHVSAYNVLHALHRGRPVVLPRRFDAATVLDLTRAHGVTAMSLAPTMLRLLLDAAGDDRSALASLRSISYGAAPMPPALLREAHDALGVGFAQGYGMTELSGNAVFLSPDDHRRGLDGDRRLLVAAGRAGPGVELRITDEAGNDVAPGAPGEIRVRSGQVCAGYWDDPDATAAAIVDGWLRTGDIGVLDDDGLLTIVDRAKDIVVTGGENVASREVEDVVGTHPAVARVAVVGLPDPRWGEAVCAAVVLRPGHAHDHQGRPGIEADVIAHARAHLAGYKVPKRVVVLDDLPTNAGGKVVKPELRRLLADDLGDDASA